MTRIFCFGGAHIDRTARCKAAFIPGASNPVVVGTTLGGAALNTALNLKRLGADVFLFSSVGEDAVGSEVAHALDKLGLSRAGLICRRNQSSANYTAILDHAGELVAGLADMEIYEGLVPSDMNRAVAACEVMPEAGDFAFLDANLPAAVLEDLSASLHAKGLSLGAASVSPAKVGRQFNILKNLNFLFCSQAELAALAQLETLDEATLRQAGCELSARHRIAVFMTRGGEGLVLFNDGVITDYPALPAEVVDVNGAGDAFAAGTLQALMQGANLAEAVGFGQATAGLTLETAGSTFANLSRDGVLARLGR